MRIITGGIFLSVLFAVAAAAQTAAQAQAPLAGSVDPLGRQSAAPTQEMATSNAPTAAATEPRPLSGAYSGSGLLMNGNAMLGIHPRQ
jgi:hypothetical protein